MNRKIAELWIADLRTNPPQSRGVLFDGNGHCCLGRLCELNGLKPVENRHSDRNTYYYDDETFMLPSQVKEWAEMKSDDGSYGSYIGVSRYIGEDSGTLTDDNDSGKTFAEIADIIEAHIEEL